MSRFVFVSVSWCHFTHTHTPNVTVQSPRAMILCFALKPTHYKNVDDDNNKRISSPGPTKKLLMLVVVVVMMMMIVSAHTGNEHELVEKVRSIEDINVFEW